jgi:hypothetical protein
MVGSLLIVGAGRPAAAHSTSAPRGPRRLRGVFYTKQSLALSLISASGDVDHNIPRRKAITRH